jgi:hypothetical protein
MESEEEGEGHEDDLPESSEYPTGTVAMEGILNNADCKFTTVSESETSQV